MPKRNLFEELKNSLENVKDFEHDRITLKSIITKSQESGKTDVVDDYLLAQEVDERLNDGDEPIKVNIDEL